MYDCVFIPHLSGQSGVKSLAVDWLTGQLYWASVTQKAIYTGAADGSAVGKVMSKEMDPSDMVLSPIERYKLLFTLVQIWGAPLYLAFFLCVVSYFGLIKQRMKKWPLRGRKWMARIGQHCCSLLHSYQEVLCWRRQHSGCIGSVFTKWWVTFEKTLILYVKCIDFVFILRSLNWYSSQLRASGQMALGGTPFWASFKEIVLRLWLYLMAGSTGLMIKNSGRLLKICLLPNKMVSS